MPAAPTTVAVCPHCFGLLPSRDLSKVDPATPVKRRGKAMSRRAGQKGYIEQSGKWWVVRFWMDVEGQQKRTLKREKICLISGPGKMTKSERQRRASEIIAASGADTEEYFNKVVKPQQEQQSGVTFREQAETWFANETSRKRKPVADSTVQFWRGCLDKWLIPNLGDLPVSAVNNGAVKRLVAIMVDELSAKTIQSYVGVVKAVVASVVNGEGEELYPRTWRAEFLDMPVVEKSRQNTPTFSAEVMSGLAKWKYPKEQMLFILCGATGLRIGEALGLEIDHISSDFLTMSIKQKARHCKIEKRVKTESAKRQVDLHPSIATLLRQFVGERRSGFLFQSRNGKPLSSSNILRRHLHPALAELGYVNPATGTHKAGNHAFRRFRHTYLKNRTGCPAGLRQYWLGHAGRDMDDLYDKIKEDVSFRQDWAEKSGFGFELPPVVPSIPKNEEIDVAERAA
ncbi:MAG: site-specific integrase [Silvibacterium sp.]|nr:site-specific integrase [Silvibacterium sp.]